MKLKRDSRDQMKLMDGNKDQKESRRLRWEPDSTREGAMKDRMRPIKDNVDSMRSRRDGWISERAEKDLDDGMNGTDMDDDTKLTDLMFRDTTTQHDCIRVAGYHAIILLKGPAII